ncbi:hypothetical protein [Streptomyces sp. NBC_00503]|uniref:hypothetical protein n=1 Tax=Streptomyces sp. NBC_00503 TaxID=2903659 RepID=UPI002E8012A1|nr:hypothetical protein [Streptomyces sp. NBC_00503]WUD79263.1 hypothetical protein OG490_00990 [Streptomyces sp. NBC_00503]
MDDHFAQALLTLRRFIGVPLPATDWRIRAVLRPDQDRIRVRLVDSLGRAAVGLGGNDGQTDGQGEPGQCGQGLGPTYELSLHGGPFTWCFPLPGLAEAVEHHAGT